MPLRNVLLTGATGLLGSNLLKHLSQEEFQIYAIKRPTSDLNLCPQSDKIIWISTENLSLEFILQLNTPFHYIIHAAGLVSYQKKDKEKLFQINSLLTREMAEAALSLKCEKFIFISSISAIGKKSESGIFDETTPWDEKQFCSNYGKSKKAAEDIVKVLGEEGLPYLIFNPSVIIGPAKPDQSSARLNSYLADGKPFYTAGTLNYIAVDDVSTAIIKGMHSKFIHQQWIINGGSVSYQEFFTLVADYLGVKPPKYKVPKAAVLVGAIVENIFSKVKGKRPTLSLETARMAGSSSIYNTDKIKRDIKMEFSSLGDAIKNTIDTMKINGLIKTIIFIPALVDFKLVISKLYWIVNNL